MLPASMLQRHYIPGSIRICSLLVGDGWRWLAGWLSKQSGEQVRAWIKCSGYCGTLDKEAPNGRMCSIFKMAQLFGSLACNSKVLIPRPFPLHPLKTPGGNKVDHNCQYTRSVRSLQASCEFSWNDQSEYVRTYGLTMRTDRVISLQN